ncbi:hypothetical protein L3V86_08390 [Thiotrichales bacterium 19S11-10]|nr:hypothetical protein [Thiotrichales bacterium 19S11-10]
MTTIHHASRKVVREAIGCPRLAEIGDLFVFRISGSKYFDEHGKFFLLPKVEHIVDQTGYSKKMCLEAIRKLDADGWINRIRIRCFDNAVRTKIYLTEKFEQLMEEVYQMFENANPPLIRHEETNNDSDDDDSGIAELNETVSSFIKDQTKKRSKDNSYNNTQDDHPSDDEEAVKVVNFKFSFDLDETSEAYQLVESVAKTNSLDFLSLLHALVDLQSTELYRTTESLIDDAIASLQRIEAKSSSIPRSFSKLLPKKAVFHAEDDRSSCLTPRQQVAVSQLITSLIKSGKASITNVQEVFRWIEYQITNPIHHFTNRGFKHCLNIIKKMLCKTGSQQYSKPFGFCV